MVSMRSLRWLGRASFALRALRAVALVLVSTWALYLALVHALIATPLLQKLLDGQPQKLYIDYGKAWSLFPGRVHVDALRIRVRDPNVDVLIAIDHADASIDLPALLVRQFTVHRVTADGVSVKVRPRLWPDEVKPESWEGAPIIDGLPPIAVRDLVRKPEVTDENYRLFTIDLQEVVASDVREIWLGPYRFHGEIDVTGSFYLRPARKVAIGPAHAEVRNGSIDLANRAFGQNVIGSIDCTVPMYDPRGDDDAEILRHFLFRLQLQSDLEDYSFLQRWLVPRGSIVVWGGRGHASTDVTVEHGVVQSGSWFTLDAKRLEARHPHLGTARADVDVRFAVERTGEGSGAEAHASMVLSRVEVVERFSEHWPLEVPRVELTARTRALDLVRAPFDDVLVAGDVPYAELVDVRVLQPFIGDAAVLGDGKGTAKLHADFDVHASVLDADADFAVERASARLGQVDLGGVIKTSVTKAHVQLDEQRATVQRVTVDLRDVMVNAQKGTPPPPWWGRIIASNVTLDAHAKDRARAQLWAKLKDARPILYVAAAEDKIPGWTKGILKLEGLTASAWLAIGKQHVALEKFEAKGGSFELGGHYRKDGEKKDGELYVGNGTLGVKIPIGGGGSVSPAIGGGPKTAQ